ncbi:MAG: hypothetical protein ACTSYB_10330 [Candidatus Helarchaeota archaeon]
MQSRKTLGIYTIAKLGKISGSEVWRQISVLIDYGLLIEKKKGNSKKTKVYQINWSNPLMKNLAELVNEYKIIEKVIYLKPLEACKRLIKKYYVTGTYAVKEMSWDICYPDGVMLAIDPKEYEKAELLKNCFINRWNFILLKKSLKDCEYYYDELEGIYKATPEQAVADGIAAYELDPNNIEILYYLLIEDLDWNKLRKLVERQWGGSALSRIYYLFALARVLGGQLFPADIFYAGPTKWKDRLFAQDAKKSCFRILLCNGITQKQGW